MTTTEISHYGVKGMKWGVRKEYVPHPRKPSRFGDQEEAAKRAFLKSRGGDIAKSIYKGKSKAWVASRLALAPVTAVAVAKSAPKLVNDSYREKRATNLKAGTKFQRITSTPDEKLQRIYATYNEHDNRMYRGRLGALRMKQNKGGTYVKEFTAKVGIKAPSDDKARSMFESLYKSDKDFANYVDNMPKLVRGYVANAKTTKDRYKNFNLQGLMDRDPENAKQVEKYYSLLSSKGYNAITDLNDRYYSTFKANNPIIIFDMKNLVETNVRKLSAKEVRDDLAYDARVRTGRAAANKWLGIENTEGSVDRFYDKQKVSHAEELIHYGVKGMKWGVRKKYIPHPLRRSKKNSVKTKRVSPKSKEDISKLSDAQLRTRLNRMQMEQQYKQLTQPKNNKNYDKLFDRNKLAKQFVERVVVGTALSIASKEANKMGTDLLNNGKDYVDAMFSRLSNQGQLRRLGLI